MFFQYYTLQKVILKTEGTQEQDRREETAKASEEEKNEDTFECEEEEVMDLKKKNKNPYADFLNAIGDGEEVSCHCTMGT